MMATYYFLIGITASISSRLVIERVPFLAMRSKKWQVFLPKAATFSFHLHFCIRTTPVSTDHFDEQRWLLGRWQQGWLFRDQGANRPSTDVPHSAGWCRTSLLSEAQNRPHQGRAARRSFWHVSGSNQPRRRVSELTGIPKASAKRMEAFPPSMRPMVLQLRCAAHIPSSIRAFLLTELFGKCASRTGCVGADKTAHMKL